MQALLFMWGNLVDGKPVEDAHYFNPKENVYVINDGVTRDVYTPGVASPAYLVASDLALIIGDFLARQSRITLAVLYQAFTQANEQARRVNEELGLWKDYNYLDRDLAGTVSVAVVVDPGQQEVWYVYIGDCGVIRYSRTGKKLFQTTNRVTEARCACPSAAMIGVQERKLRMRRDYRNRLGVDHPTYGVLTGEQSVLGYALADHHPYSRGDIIALYSDGMEAFLSNPHFVELLRKGSKEDIEAHVTEHSRPDKNYDDKTLILIRTE